MECLRRINELTFDFSQMTQLPHRLIGLRSNLGVTQTSASYYVSTTTWPTDGALMAIALSCTDLGPISSDRYADNLHKITLLLSSPSLSIDYLLESLQDDTVLSCLASICYHATKCSCTSHTTSQDQFAGRATIEIYQLGDDCT